MHQDYKKHNKFSKLQNKLRGFISSYKSRAFVKDRRRKPLSILRSSLREHLLESRAFLNLSQYRKYINWLYYQVQTQIPELKSGLIGYDELWGVYTDAPIVSLEDEVIWISERLRFERETINRYLILKGKLESLIFQRNFDSAKQLQEDIFKNFGVSFHGIQTRIALESASGGLDSQKRYSSEVRGIYKGGLLSFITYYTSMRNEEGVGIDKLLENLQSRLERNKTYPPDVKTYLEYQITNILPSTESGLADILRVEQSHSLIDIYETFINVFIQIVKAENSVISDTVLLRVLDNLTMVEDFRLTKLKAIISNISSCSKLPLRVTHISNSLFSKKYKLATKCYLKELKERESIDPWSILYASFALCGQNDRHRDLTSKIQDIPVLLASVLSLSKQSSLAFELLLKSLINYKGLTSVQGILHFMDLFDEVAIGEKPKVWSVGIFSKYIGVEDCVNESSFNLFNSVFKHNKGEATNQKWAELFNSSLSFDHKSVTFFGLVREYSRNNYEDMLNNIRINKNNSELNNIGALVSALSMGALIGVSDAERIIKHIVYESTNNPVNSLLLPVPAILRDYRWPDYVMINEPLIAPIALYLLWKDEPTPEIESILRYSIRHTHKNEKYKLPSELSEYRNQIDQKILIFYLSHVCSLSFIDQVRKLTGTHDLLDERQNICSLLCTLDPDYTDNYQDQIGEIEYIRRLEVGEWIVDKSRIHVDTDALKRWCNSELFVDFNRYKELTSVDSDSDTDTDEILKELLSNDDSGVKFEINSESDQVLISMIYTIASEFMNNSSFGLDFHLSKRIRHQSFVGLIRGPAESYGLITTKQSEQGEYHSNEEYLRKLGKLDPREKNHIDIAFKRFSRSFDDALKYAKDNKFQINSAKHPKGLISFQLTHQHLRLLQSLGRTTKKLEEFVDSLVAVMWASIEPFLKNTRKYIEEDLKQQLAITFDQLKGIVASQTDRQSSEFLNFSYNVQQCSSEVQNALDRAGQWFSRMSNAIDTEKLLVLEEMVQIAIQSSLKCYKSIKPNITLDIRDSLTKMAASNIVIIYDTIFVALGNVYKHSGLIAPNVHIRSEINLDEHTLSLNIISDVKPGLQLEYEKRLLEVQKKIEDRDFGDQTRKEHRSGFLKLAAVTTHSDKGRINFGFCKENTFELNVVYELKVKSFDIEANIDENIAS